MSEAKATDAKKGTVDTNPNSKKNLAFRRRHDISLSDFKRSLKRYQTQYG